MEKFGKFIAFILMAVAMVVLQIAVVAFFYWLLTLFLPITFNLRYAVGIYIALNLLKGIISFLKSDD